MKTFIHEIGVIDYKEKKHKVSFKEGLNIVTGKSSTGKSALIEIFDYCFGRSENNIPKGVITDVANIYYVIFLVKDKLIIIARGPKFKKKAYLKEITNSNYHICGNFFDEKYRFDLDMYKKKLNSYFLDIYDVDESLEAKKYKNNKSSPTPSIRSFPSFILQHQNIIANKDVLFCRFDNNEKRKQLIEHIKIFLGFVDQNYFILSQEKESLKKDLKQKNNQLIYQLELLNNSKKTISPTLRVLSKMINININDENIDEKIENFIDNPDEAKKYLNESIKSYKINYDPQELINEWNKNKKIRDEKYADLLILEKQKSNINKNIKNIETFLKNIDNSHITKNAEISEFCCPFCLSENDNLNKSSLKLQEAMKTLDSDIIYTNKKNAEWKVALHSLKRDIKKKDSELKEIDEYIKKIEKENEKIKEHKDIYESILEQKVKLLQYLDILSKKENIDLDKEKKKIEKALEDVRGKLKDHYNVGDLLQNASEKVNQYMAEIGENFAFENSYKPINLKFSFETFELYHLNKKGERIYIKNMGSGANWLYCHITLFLALHKYFAELGDKCSIPSILFIDQPTQVYYPNFNLDKSESFDEHKKSYEKDEDSKAVENLFVRLLEYCDKLKDELGFSPQIIVTDHVDNLDLDGKTTFDSLVNGNRFRNRGFIKE